VKEWEVIGRKKRKDAKIQNNVQNLLLLDSFCKNLNFQKVLALLKSSKSFENHN